MSNKSTWLKVGVVGASIVTIGLTVTMILRQRRDRRNAHYERVKRYIENPGRKHVFNGALEILYCGEGYAIMFNSEYMGKPTYWLAEILNEPDFYQYFLHGCDRGNADMVNGKRLTETYRLIDQAFNLSDVIKKHTKYAKQSTVVIPSKRHEDVSPGLTADHASDLSYITKRPTAVIPSERKKVVQDTLVSSPSRLEESISGATKTSATRPEESVSGATNQLNKCCACGVQSESLCNYFNSDMLICTSCKEADNVKFDTTYPYYAPRSYLLNTLRSDGQSTTPGLTYGQEKWRQWLQLPAEKKEPNKG